MSGRPLKDLAQRIKADPSLISDAEIISEVKRPRQKQADPVAKPEVDAGTGPRVEKPAFDRMNKSGEAASSKIKEPAAKPESTEDVKSGIKSKINSLRETVQKKQGSVKDDMLKRANQVWSDTKDKVKPAEGGFKRNLKSGVEMLTSGIFTKADDAPDKLSKDAPSGDDESVKILTAMDSKLSHISGLLTGQLKTLQLLSNRASKSTPQALPRKLNVPLLAAPKYSSRGGSGLKRNAGAGGRIIDMPAFNKPQALLPAPVNDAAKAAEGSNTGGFMSTVSDAMDAMKNKMPKGVMGKLAKGALRFAGPAAAVAGAGAAGYEAGSYLNSFVDNAKEGTALGAVKTARDSTFDTLLSGADAVTGGAISGNKEQASKNWNDSAGGKAWNRMTGKDKQLELANKFEGSAPISGLTPEQTKAYAGNTGYTESGGKMDVVNKYGYTGQYQFGADALADNGFVDKEKLAAAKKDAKSSGVSWYKDGAHKKFMDDGANWTNEGGRDAFVGNKKVQDDLFVKYTNKNVEAGKKSGALSDTSTPEQIAAYAKASHLKGVGGANKFFLEGKDSADANGTSVSKYAAGAAESMTELSKRVEGSANSSQLAKVNNPVLASNEVERQTINSQTSSSPVIVPVSVPGAPAPQPSLAQSSTNMSGIPMASRNMDNSIQRITAGQMSYGYA